MVARWLAGAYILLNHNDNHQWPRSSRYKLNLSQIAGQLACYPTDAAYYELTDLQHE